MDVQNKPVRNISQRRRKRNFLKAKKYINYMYTCVCARARVGMFLEIKYCLLTVLGVVSRNKYVCFVMCQELLIS